MKRRTTLSFLTAGLVSIISGCLTGSIRDAVTPTSANGAIEATSFQILGNDANPGQSGNPPTVRFNGETKQVIITGRLYVGSIECNEAVLQNVTYKQSENRLSVVVTHGKSDAHPDNQLFGSGVCDAAMSSDAYRAVVTFRKRLPGRVLATERGALGDTTSVTATYDM
ncbi:hypothetical protein ACFFQF_23740 [Haladaptatus pallidirubidus]|uniref:hypothetical protein n=1 Tax=Haladaptatus pallidirubidus TaxID=1008152 RepID=UPI0035E87683